VSEAAAYLQDRRDATEEGQRLTSEAIAWLRRKRDESRGRDKERKSATRRSKIQAQRSRRGSREGKGVTPHHDELSANEHVIVRDHYPYDVDLPHCCACLGDCLLRRGYGPIHGVSIIPNACCGPIKSISEGVVFIGMFVSAVADWVRGRPSWAPFREINRWKV